MLLKTMISEEPTMQNHVLTSTPLPSSFSSCPFPCLRPCLSQFPSLGLPTRLSPLLSQCLFPCPPKNLLKSPCLSTCLSTRLSPNLSPCLSPLPVSLIVFLSASLSVCVPDPKSLRKVSQHGCLTWINSGSTDVIISMEKLR